MASLPQFTMKINVNRWFDVECSSNIKTNFKIVVKPLFKLTYKTSYRDFNFKSLDRKSHNPLYEGKKMKPIIVM